MRMVTQTILAKPELAEQGIAGNCMQAAIASLLELPIDAVPHFAQFVWWPGAIEFWARGRHLTRRVEHTDIIPQALCIVAGNSPRTGTHVCVAEGGEIIWDPHPSQDGLTSIDEVWFFEPWPTETKTCYACGSSTGSDLDRLADAMALLDRLNAADLAALDEQALTTALVRVGHVRVASNALRVRIGQALDAVSRERVS